MRAERQPGDEPSAAETAVAPGDPTGLPTTASDSADADSADAGEGDASEDDGSPDDGSPDDGSPDDGSPDDGSEDGSGVGPEHHLHLPHPHLIDAEEDRWAWRASIRRDPRKLFFYRIGVGVAGLFLMIAAVVLGPLPGPGGIPLFLLGLAVWASEFEWAQNVMLWFKRQFERYLGWNRPRRILFWVVLILFFWLMGYLAMLAYGIPPWAPELVRGWLSHLPGLIPRRTR